MDGRVAGFGMALGAAMVVALASTGCQDDEAAPLANVLPEPGMAVAPPPPTPGACTYGPPLDGQRPLKTGDDVGEGFYAVTSPPPGPRTGPDDLELNLEGTTEVKVDGALDLKLRFTNGTDAPMVVMRALDGSAVHWRFPTYDIYARDEAGQIYRWAYVGGRCGNVNPIVEEDYLRLAPGASRDDVAGSWANLWAVHFPRPGRYTVWVVYTMCDSDDVKGLGAKDGLRAALTQHDVTFGRHRSNGIVVNVE